MRDSGGPGYGIAVRPLAPTPLGGNLDTPLHSRFRAASRLGGGLLAALGASALLGWLLHIPALRSMVPAATGMKVNTALLFVLYGAALMRRPARPDRGDLVFGSIVMSVAGLVLSQHLFGVNLGIDELLGHDPPTAGVAGAPGRMAEATAISFLCLGIALPLMDTAWRPLADMCLVLVASVSFVACSGYLQGLDVLSRLGMETPVALNTALGLGIASLASAASRPTGGLGSLLASDTTAGAAARRALPLILGATLALGWGAQEAIRGQWVDEGTVATGGVLLAMVSAGGLTLGMLGRLNSSELVRLGAESTLAQREEELATTLHSIGEAVISTDPEGRVARMNLMAEQLTGWSEADARGRPLSDVYHLVDPETRSALESPLERVRRGADSALANHRLLVARGGTERPVGDTAAPIRGGDGAMRGVVLVFHDMTREVQARRAESLAAGRCQLLAGLSAEFAMVGHDVAGLLDVLASRASEAIGDVGLATLNDPVASLASHTDTAIRSPDRGLEGEIQVLLAIPGLNLGQGISARVAETGVSLLVAVTRPEELIARAPAHLRPVVRRCAPTSVLCVPLRARGRCLGVLTLTRHSPGRAYTATDIDLASEIADRAGIALDNALLLRDIAARVAELSHAKEQLRAVLETMPMSLLVSDETGRVQMVNATAESAFGYPRAELLGSSVEMLVPVPCRAAHAAQRLTATRPSDHARLMVPREVSARRRDGTEFPVEITLGSIELPEGRWTVAAIQDVTRRRALEDSSRRAFELEERSRRAEEANRLKSEFLAHMSHELRTPLNAILGFTGLIVDGQAGPVSDKHREYLTDVIGSARHLLQLINDLLDISKIEAAQMEIERQPFDLGALAREVVATGQGLTAGRQLTLECNVQPGLPAVWSDRRRVKQVLYNLWSNAIKFTEDGGAIGVEVLVDEHGGARLTVSDTGIGIAPDHFERVFLPFQQLDSGRSRKFAGTGLGLALTRRLVEALGGTIALKSEVGRGTAFTVSLPGDHRPSVGDPS